MFNQLHYYNRKMKSLNDDGFQNQIKSHFINTTTY